jgi:hypothetical protein
MLLAAVLLLGARAQCSLASDIDPDGICNVDSESGFANINMDAIANPLISVAVSTKGEYTDMNGVVHGATQGGLVYHAADGRYVLDCPQAADQLTVKVTLTRPQAYAGCIGTGADEVCAYRAEWVALYPKDSWIKNTSGFEPNTHNNYGNEIPLPELRYSDGTVGWKDVAYADDFNVYMEVSGKGDYELKFANPHLTHNGNWVAFEFKSTLLRVGSPWASCSSPTTAGTADYSGQGTIIPAYYGSPFHQKATYDLLISELTDVTVPVKVILKMFGPSMDTLTSSATATHGCFAAGNECPALYTACAPENCLIDRYKKLITDLKGASSTVSVLAFVETKATGVARTTADIDVDIAEYDAVGSFDGFYFHEVGGGAGPLAQVATIAGTVTGFKVMGLGEPLFDDSVLALLMCGLRCRLARIASGSGRRFPGFRRPPP